MTTDAKSGVQLPASLRAAAEKAAAAAGMTLEKFVIAAVAAKLSAEETAAFFAERARRADPDAFDRFMSRPNSAPPRPDDLIDE